MSTEPFMITIDYARGNRLVRHVPAVSDADLELAAAHVAALAAYCEAAGIDLAEVMVAVVELEHEDTIYRQACERRGVLAL